MADAAAPWLNANRKKTVIGMAVGTPLFLLMYAVLMYAVWEPYPADMTRVDMLATAFKWSVLVGIITSLLMQLCFRLFDTSPDAERPELGAESERWKRSQRILTNTVEQAVIFLPILYALAATIDAGHFHLIPVLCVIWTTGRVLFLVGYHIDASMRGPGLQLSLFTSLLGAGWLAYILFLV